MFSLLHYFPKSSFTGLILPKTRYVLSKASVCAKQVLESVPLENDGYIYIKRINEHMWENKLYKVNFETRTIINYNKYDIKENINVNMCNHTFNNENNIVIKINYDLEILDGKERYFHRLNDFEYDFATNNLVHLDKFYNKHIITIYNELKHIK